MPNKYQTSSFKTVHTTILLDASDAMASAPESPDKLSRVVSAVKMFIELKKEHSPNDIMSIISFGNICWFRAKKENLLHGHENLSNALAKIELSGKANFWDALLYAERAFSSSSYSESDRLLGYLNTDLGNEALVDESDDFCITHEHLILVTASEHDDSKDQRGITWRLQNRNLKIDCIWIGDKPLHKSDKFFKGIASTDNKNHLRYSVIKEPSSLFQHLKKIAIEQNSGE